MNYRTEDLSQQFAHLILEQSGEHTFFQCISPCENIKQDSLVFLNDCDYLEKAQSLASVIICTPNVFALAKKSFAGYLACVTDIRIAQARIKQAFDDYQAIDKEWGDIHPSAIIHPSAKIGSGCHIGPHCVIGANCTIGDHVVIRSGSIIEHDASIASNSLIYPLVNIGYACEIGSDVIIHSGVIIGNEGFGFAKDENSAYVRVPHTGKVIIENNVSIGANCTIDRATYGETRICQGCKIDALCHIAHNVLIGENTLIVAQTGIAGSCTIGKRVIMSGQTGMLDHKTVADDAILLHRAGVTTDVPTAGKWAGKPVRPLKEYVRDVNLAKTVKRLTKKIEQLEQKLPTSE